MAELKTEKDQHDAELTRFNQELGRHLSSLDRGESVKPATVRASTAEVARPPAAARVSGYVHTVTRILIKQTDETYWPRVTKVRQFPIIKCASLYSTSSTVEPRTRLLSARSRSARCEISIAHDRRTPLSSPRTNRNVTSFTTPKSGER